MSKFRIVFFALAATALFNFVYFVLVMRLHAWDRVIFGFPFGVAWGWFEIILYGFFGLVAVKYFIEEIRIEASKRRMLRKSIYGWSAFCPLSKW